MVSGATLRWRIPFPWLEVNPEDPLQSGVVVDSWRLEPTLPPHEIFVTVVGVSISPLSLGRTLSHVLRAL